MVISKDTDLGNTSDNHFPDLYCNKVAEVFYPNQKKDLSRLKEISKIINIEVDNESPLSHSDIQTKLLLIGSYLNYRTYTPVSKHRCFNRLV